MVIRSVNLETVCGVTSRLPDNHLPEFAFAGKSNVGKSTLINGLMIRKAYARTSAKPGKTQTINYYNINDSLYLVDLPGYGYATAGVEVKKKWGRMIENYLHNSPTLAAVFLLVDIRHDPGANDVQMYDWILQAGFKPYIIATKADKLKRSQVAGRCREIREYLAKKSQVSAEVSVAPIPYSGITKAGRDDIYKILESFVQGEEADAIEVL